MVPHRRAAGSGFLGAIQLPPAAHMHLACKPQRACCLQAAPGRSELESRAHPYRPNAQGLMDFLAHTTGSYQYATGASVKLHEPVCSRRAPRSHDFVDVRGGMRTKGATCTAAPKRMRRCKYAAAREHDRNRGGICATAASHPEPLGQQRQPRRHQTTSRPLHSTRADETSRYSIGGESLAFSLG